MFSSRVFLVVGVLFAEFLLTELLAAQEEVLKRIEDDWRARRNLVTRVSYRAEGTVIYPVGSMNEALADIEEMGTLPEADYISPLHQIVLLDFSERRVRKERTRDILFVKDRQFVTICEARLFNGKDFQVYQPRNRNQPLIKRPEKFVELTLWPESYGTLIFERGADYPYFFGHGIVAGLPDVNKLGPTSPSIDFSKYTVERTTRFMGTDVVIVRAQDNESENIHEYWIDPSRQSAILHWRYYFPDQERPHSTLTIFYQETDRGWFPKKWRYELMNDDELARIETLSVAEIVFDPDFDESAFHVTSEAGIVIEDLREKP